MNYYLKIPNFSLEKTLFCGQAFRWKKIGEIEYFGVVGDRELFVRQDADGITLLDIEDKDIPFWEEYFDVGTDYDKLVADFSQDETLKKACEYGHGLRVLVQPPFETLITFIISQNNNIKRIGGIVERLCEYFGERTKNSFAFPTASCLANQNEESLAVLRAGFRARYILDAARRVDSGEIDLNQLYALSAEQAKAQLLKIVGVGDKVADCVLLFAYAKTESVPKDVWIKRAMSLYYPEGLPLCVGDHAGIAQQYLFEYIRNN